MGPQPIGCRLGCRFIVADITDFKETISAIFKICNYLQYHNYSVILQLFHNIITVLLELIQKDFHNLRFLRSHSYKRERKKKTLEMFLKKPLTTSNPFYFIIMIQKAVSKLFLQKRKKKEC